MKKPIKWLNRINVRFAKKSSNKKVPSKSIWQPSIRCKSGFNFLNIHDTFFLWTLILIENIFQMNRFTHSAERAIEDETIQFIKEDPNNPNTYKIICAGNAEAIVDSNYEIQNNDETVLEIYDFQDDDECMKKEPGVPDIAPVQLTDAELKENIAKLLKTVVDEDVLKKFGYMKAPIEKVLSNVIKQCGQSPVDHTTCTDSSSKLRENVKLLFTSVIDDESIKEMLNNHTIDEVVCHVIKLSETNE